MPNLFYLTFAALFGLVLGSFINVVILRDDRRWSILTERSECPHCKRQLRWYDLVPVLSFLQLRGHCRTCHKPISWQYPLVELLAALLTMYAVWWGYIGQGNWLVAATLIVVFLMLLAISVIDIRTLTIPVEYTVVVAVVGMLGFGITHTITWISLVFGLLAAGGIIAAILYGWRFLFHQDGMGEGDIWLAAAIGAVVGFPLVLVALMAAVFIGAAIGVVLIASNGKDLKTAVPFGPFLALGLLISLQFGSLILNLYRF